MRRLRLTSLVLATLLCLAPRDAVRGADHGDSPLLVGLARHDARITDLLVFTAGDNLVLALCTNPAIPPGMTTYRFAEDLTLRFHIDTDSPVSFADPQAVREFGGTLLDPARISEDIGLEFTFDADGRARLDLRGLPHRDVAAIRVFTGLRDDPFIRGPRIGRNVAAVVVEMPLSLVLGAQSTILVWATTKVPEVRGPISEHAGRALLSMFPAQDLLNTTSPPNHFRQFGERPDVVIFDTSLPAGFPNGRAPQDDVVDLTNIESMMSSDSPWPSANDVPMPAEFPWLAPPQ